MRRTKGPDAMPTGPNRGEIRVLMGFGKGLLAACLALPSGGGVVPPLPQRGGGGRRFCVRAGWGGGARPRPLVAGVRGLVVVGVVPPPPQPSPTRGEGGAFALGLGMGGRALPLPLVGG